MKNSNLYISTLIVFFTTISSLVAIGQSTPPITNINGTVCVGDNAQFRVTTSCSIMQWTASSGGVIQGANNLATVIIKWSTASTNAWIQVTYSNCNTSFLALTVYAKTTPTVSLTLSPTTICQPQTLTFQAATTNVSGSPSYKWYIDSQLLTTTTTPTYNYPASTLTPGTHNAWVTISNMSCSNLTTVTSASKSFTVNPNVGQVSAPSGITSRCIGSGSNTYTASASSATGYSWSITPAAGTISSGGVVTWNSSFSGTATITVTANGCNASSSSASANVAVTPGVGQVSVPTGTPSRCIGSGTDTYSATASNATSYSWTLSPLEAGSISPQGGTVVWNSSFSGLATVSVTANGCTGATTSNSTNVNVIPLVGQVSSPSGALSRCIGSGSNTYTASASNATSYAWSITPEAGTISAGGAVTWNSTFSGSATVTVTATGCRGSTSSASTNVAVTPLVGQVTAPSGITSRCIGNGSNTYTASASNATGYAWSITSAAGTISNSGVVTWVSSFSGTATITVTANGCNASSSSATTNVAVTPGVGQVGAPTGITSRCIGSGTDTYSATASNATSYSWTLSPLEAGSISPQGGTVVWSSTFSGPATISVTANGCTSATSSASTNVNVIPLVGPVNAPTGDLSRCIGSGTSSYSATASDATSYSWSITPAAGTISSTGVVTWNSTFSGPATISVNATGCHGSTSSASRNVEVIPLVGQVSAPSGVTTRCVGSGTSTYTASAPNALSYSWNITLAAGTISSGGVVTWNSTFSSTATVTVTANGCNGTTSTASLAVVVENIGAVSLTGISQRCAGSGSDPFSASANNAVSFSYQLEPSSAGTIVNGAAGYVTWDPAFFGTAIVTATGTGCNGATRIATKSVYVTPNVSQVSAPFGKTSGCQGLGPTTYTASSVNTTGYTWSISPSNAGSIVNGGVAYGLSKGTVSWNSGFSGTATISVTASGCSPTNASTNVEIRTMPSATFTPTGTISTVPTTLSSPFVSGYIYQWFQNGFPISGENKFEKIVSQPGSYQVMVSNGPCSALSPTPASVIVGDYSGLTDPNFIKERLALVDKRQDGQPLTEVDMGTVSIGERQETVNYFDGLGRAMQRVITQGSPSHSDEIQPIIYDNYGRESVKYLPYTSGSDGTFKSTFSVKELVDYTTSPQYQFYQSTPRTATDSKPYGETIFEASPLNRPVKNYGPGNSWSASVNNKFIQQQYLNNIHNTGVSATGEKIIAWRVDVTGMPVKMDPLLNFIESGGYFSSNKIIISGTVDEEGHATREYRNKLGHVILKKVQVVTGSTNLNSTTDWALTYYLYDDLGNLRYVFQPELSKKIHDEIDSYVVTADDLNNFAFTYRYDSRNRMIYKQVPGAAAVFMVYDKRDRLVLTQDGELRKTNKWTFIKYDALNRPILTGLYTHGSAVDQAVMSSQISTVNFHETYDGSAATHGYSTNTVFPTTNLEILTVTYYDNYLFKSILPGDYGYVNLGLTETRNSITYTQPANESARVTGQVTCSKIKVMDSNGAAGYTWLTTLNYYDDKYRLIQSISDNYKGGSDQITILYDFTGRVLKTKAAHSERDVTWKDRLGVAVIGNKLIKNISGSGWNTAGAVSQQQLAAGQNGWMEVFASETNLYRMIGFSDQNTDANYPNLA